MSMVGILSEGITEGDSVCMLRQWFSVLLHRESDDDECRGAHKPLAHTNEGVYDGHYTMDQELVELASAILI